MGLHWETPESTHTPDAHFDHVKGALRKVENTIGMPPDTWEQYMGQPHGWVSILDMEMGEMEKAYAAKREGTGTEEAFAHELIHVATACLCLYAHIMDNK